MVIGLVFPRIDIIHFQPIMTLSLTWDTFVFNLHVVVKSLQVTFFTKRTSFNKDEASTAPVTASIGQTSGLGQNITVTRYVVTIVMLIVPTVKGAHHLKTTIYILGVQKKSVLRQFSALSRLPTMDIFL